MAVESKWICFHRLSSNRDAKNTIVDVFATFIFLSYAKMLFMCIRTLSLERRYTLNNSLLQTSFYTRSDSSIEYFSVEHLPFAIASIIILLFVFVPLTLLLTLYPVRCFRVILFACIKSRTAVLNMFVEKFYSCYRDSLDGGKDMRSFVSCSILPCHTNKQSLFSACMVCSDHCTLCDQQHSDFPYSTLQEKVHELN